MNIHHHQRYIIKKCYGLSLHKSSFKIGSIIFTIEVSFYVHDSSCHVQVENSSNIQILIILRCWSRQDKAF